MTDWLPADYIVGQVADSVAISGHRRVRGQAKGVPRRWVGAGQALIGPENPAGVVDLHSERVLKP